MWFGHNQEDGFTHRPTMLGKIAIGLVGGLIIAATVYNHYFQAPTVAAVPQTGVHYASTGSQEFHFPRAIEAHKTRTETQTHAPKSISHVTPKKSSEQEMRDKMRLLAHWSDPLVEEKERVQPQTVSTSPTKPSTSD